MSRYTSIGFLLLSGVLAACGGDDKNAQTGQPAAVQCPPGQIYDGRLCQTVGAVGAPTATAPAGTAPVATGVPAGTAAPGIPGGVIATTTAGPTAQPLDPAGAAAATQLINALAAQQAPAGAKPVGSVLAGNFQQGQSLEAQFQMNVGKCYTVVGQGLPPVTNLDIAVALVTPMPGLAPTLGADNSVAASAVVGGKPDCMKTIFPAAVKLVLTVSQGSGVAAAQVYEK